MQGALVIFVLIAQLLNGIRHYLQLLLVGTKHWVGHMAWAMVQVTG